MLKVLIAEDDLMFADLAEEILVDEGYEGYEVCGIARTVAEAVILAHQYKPVLDLRLADGGLGTEIAAQLRPLGRLGCFMPPATCRRSC